MAIWVNGEEESREIVLSVQFDDDDDYITLKEIELPDVEKRQFEN